ncbi:serine hydrolase domain-containing protein [Ramlibacter sp. AN1133]|uniref:serine hydrolase domain-containing protein n=1 Tax=Ramlibacter sp. AN1133 TaxID=3133429 RepID=UPI0030BD11E2
MKAGALLWLALACGVARAEPDADLLGAARDYPVGSAATWYQVPYRVGSWSALDQVQGFHVRRVAAPAQAQPLPRAAQPVEIRYRYRNIGYTLQDYLERQRATGLLVLKDGEIVAEHYRYGRKEDARFLSFSMAKSVTSLLVGVALDKGLIASLDDPAAKYAPALAGTPYGETAIRHLLRMSSGLTFTERYDGNDDVARMTRAFDAPGGTAEVLRSISDRHSPAGTVFKYASAETEVLGRVLAGATGRTLAELTSEWLWTPIGAERDAFWRIGGDGQEGAYAYFNATLRDYARLGLLLARDGRVGERQVVPREYLLDATDAKRQPAAFRPRRATPFFGYGYQFWLLPLAERTFALQGVYGQGLYVQPASGIVLVVTSVWQQASGQQDPAPVEERNALWMGVLRSLGGRTD